MMRLIAVVGILIGLVSMGLAKPPENQGIPYKPPAVESETTQQSDSKEGPAIQVPIPLPVRIIEGESDAKHTKEREAKTDEHDAKDLDAQIRSAQAAEKQLRIAYLSAVFALIGTIFLIWNLLEARSANAHTLKAIDQEQTNAQKQLRAYVLSHEVVLNNWDTIPEAVVHISNFGQTPAKDVIIWSRLQVSKYPPNPDIFVKPADLLYSKSHLAPTGKMLHDLKYGIALTEPWLELLRNGNAAIYVVGEVTYVDVFGHPQWSTFRYMRGGPLGAPVNGEMPTAESGNNGT